MKHDFFCEDRMVFVAGRVWAVCVDSGGILLFLYSVIWSYSEQNPKKEYFRFHDGVQVTNISGN